ncbi:TBC1 domain family member 15 isoform X2 [Hyalella azteca]|uniref:TBC1 domain family member 15 n=1 Tax=Hyalella azteca TaxID=294128 RepID=A0A8B7N0D7_HYAAZ|nr:TBC1 domain family member 15 isoform X2 [Hyalella azteca]
MEEETLVYQQDEVHTIPTSLEELSVAGRLRIIERRHSAYIEWRCSDDESNPDNDWAVVNKSAVTFTHHNSSGSVEISTPRRHVRPISVELADLGSYKLTIEGSLVLIQRDGSTHPALQFPGKDAEYFVEVLSRYVAIKRSEKDSTLFLLRDKKTARIDDQLSALGLVSHASRGSRVRKLHGSSSSDSKSRGSPQHTSSSQVELHSAVVPWTTAAPQRVMGFISNFRRDPYTTTLTTLSKFYDIVLSEDDWAEGFVSERGGDDLNPFASLSGLDNLEPGFQVVTLKGKLVERPRVERLPPLTQLEYSQHCDVDGGVRDPQLLKRRIFKGGIHPSLRSELWCYLLGYYDWSSSSAQREVRRNERLVEYQKLKLQWSTMTADQELRNSGFRERKSLIEKDVNRTDRSHPFYEGDDNPNVQLLHNILMSYVMFNFDLGYVQGMSDLLAPILYVTQNECAAFWCFVGYIDIVHRNFDMDQSGMKEQLLGLQHLIAVIDPEFMSYLESSESANLYFCFRWLLVRFKRELSYSDTLRLWEVLWSQEPCKNFHLLVAAAILDHERNTIMENKFEFTEILKHINDTSQRLNLEELLCSAEAIYEQLVASSDVPAAVLTLLGLPLKPSSQDGEADVSVGELASEKCVSTDEETSPLESSRIISAGPSSSRGKKENFVLYRRCDHNDDDDFLSEEDTSGDSCGGAGDNNASVVPRGDTSATDGAPRGLVGTVTSILGSAVRHIAGEDASIDLLSPISAALHNEGLFEDAIGQQYL